MLHFLQRPLSLPFVLTICLFLTWISLHFHTASKASSSSLQWSAIDDINANLLRFRSGIPSKILKDERGWLLDPLSLASSSGISGGAITCASIHAGEIRPGKLRGNHRHHDCNETLVIWGAMTRYREKAETEIRKLRQSFCFKARPLPDFYKERKESNKETQKIS